MENMGLHMNRRDPGYLDAVVKKKSQRDPKEDAIRGKIEHCMTREAWNRDALESVRKIQKEHLTDMIAHVDDESYVHDQTQLKLREISGLMRSKIIEGGKFLEALPPGTPTLIATNHFGAYKLTGLNPREDLGVDIPNYDAMYPYLMYFAALSPVADTLGDNLYYASEDFPLIFGEIHTKAGFVHIPPASIHVEGGRTPYLIEETRSLLEKHPNAAIVNFPEGGTSGKYSGLGPYDLDPFKTGAYVIATKLGLHLIPVAQYFDAKDGFQLKVHRPFVPTVSTKEELEEIASANRSEMQAWFDQRKNS